jgi:hypothetical protein
MPYGMKFYQKGKGQKQKGGNGIVAAGKWANSELDHVFNSWR